MDDLLGAYIYTKNVELNDPLVWSVICTGSTQVSKYSTQKSMLNIHQSKQNALSILYKSGQELCGRASSSEFK